MRKKRPTDKKTVAWWEELANYKQDDRCCTLLKEGSLEEHLKLEFGDTVPVKFSVNCCCQCGSPVRAGVERNEGKKEDWCCRVMRSLRLELIKFSGIKEEIDSVQVTHCFHCGRELRKINDGGKISARGEDDKRD